MTRWRHIAITLFLSVSVLCFSQHTDRLLTQAYLSEDMQVWGDYLATAEWDTACSSERERILLYEYGYIPYLMDRKDTAECRRCFRRYQRQIDEQASQLTPAVYCAHRSAAHAYAYMLGEGGMKDALLSLRYARQAVQNDSLNALAWHLRAGVYFYAPRIAGGSKRKALDCYEQALQRAAADSVASNQWLCPAAHLGIAQCYYAMRDYHNALIHCRYIQQQYPGFRYVNEQFLPRLSH